MKKLVIAAAMALYACPALAQATIDAQSAYTQVLAPILTGIGIILSAVLTALASLAIKWVSNKLGLQGLEFDQQHRDTLETALENAAGLLISKGGDALSGKEIKIDNPLVAQSVLYVVKNAPDALAHFNLKDKFQDIAEKIIAKLPQVQQAPTPMQLRRSMRRAV